MTCMSMTRKMGRKEMKIRTLNLFSGIGAFEKGIERRFK